MNNNLFNNYNPNIIVDNNYVTDYLKKNIGQRIKVYVSFSDSIEWRDSVFIGNLEIVGKDYIVVNSNNEKHIIWCIYIDYVTIE